MVLPHGYEVLRADYQRAEEVNVLENAGQAGRNQRLAQADNVADEDAAPLVEMVGGDFDRCFLELKELAAKITRDLELGEARSGVARKMVRHLEVDIVGRH